MNDYYWLLFYFFLEANLRYLARKCHLKKIIWAVVMVVIVHKLKEAVKMSKWSSECQCSIIIIIISLGNHFKISNGQIILISTKAHTQVANVGKMLKKLKPSLYSDYGQSLHTHTHTLQLRALIKWLSISVGEGNDASCARTTVGSAATSCTAVLLNICPVWSSFAISPSFREIWDSGSSYFKFVSYTLCAGQLQKGAN